MGIPPGRRRGWQATAIGLVILLSPGGIGPSGAADGAGPPEPRARELGRPSDLPLPSRGSVAQFEEKLFAFLNTRQYVQRGWPRDKGVRDTGPYIGGKSYGSHP